MDFVKEHIGTELQFTLSGELDVESTEQIRNEFVQLAALRKTLPPSPLI